MGRLVQYHPVKVTQNLLTVSAAITNLNPNVEKMTEDIFRKNDISFRIWTFKFCAPFKIYVLKML
jgi:hypothetical protein